MPDTLCGQLVIPQHRPTPFHCRARVEREILQAEVSAEFTEKVSELRRVLATELLVEPHKFGDRSIEGGVALAALLTKVCEAINEGSSNLVPLRWVGCVQVKDPPGKFDFSPSND